jgi:hypothetical protein
MVRINKTLSIDHEVLGKYVEAVGHRHESDDIEVYMRSRIEEYEKIRNLSNNNSNGVISNDSNQSLMLEKKKIVIDVLNMDKSELNRDLRRISDIRELGRIQGNASMVRSVAKTRIQELRWTNGQVR